MPLNRARQLLPRHRRVPRRRRPARRQGGKGPRVRKGEAGLCSEKASRAGPGIRRGRRGKEVRGSEPHPGRAGRVRLAGPASCDVEDPHRRTGKGTTDLRGTRQDQRCRRTDPDTGARGGRPGKICAEQRDRTRTVDSHQLSLVWEADPRLRRVWFFLHLDIFYGR